MMKHCLGCDKEFEGSMQAKYHDVACSDKARKRKQRGVISSDLSGAEEEVKVVPEGVVEAPGLDLSLRNTIHDPNPAWNPEKKVTENNRGMVCPLCGKLSLTHPEMCTYRNGDTRPVYGY